jgi:hypothetical protein
VLADRHRTGAIGEALFEFENETTHVREDDDGQATADRLIAGR